MAVRTPPLSIQGWPRTIVFHVSTWLSTLVPNEPNDREASIRSKRLSRTSSQAVVHELPREFPKRSFAATTLIPNEQPRLQETQSFANRTHLASCLIVPYTRCNKADRRFQDDVRKQLHQQNRWASI